MEKTLAGTQQDQWALCCRKGTNKHMIMVKQLKQKYISQLCFSEQLKLVRVSWITFNLPRAATQELFYLSH